MLLHGRYGNLTLFAGVPWLSDFRQDLCIFYPPETVSAVAA